MGRKDCCSCCISKTVILFFGILFGAACSAMWFFGFMEFVRPITPYVFVFGLTALTVTAIIGARCNAKGLFSEIQDKDGECENEGCHHRVNRTCSSVRRYANLIIVSGGVVVVFALTVMATYLSLIARYVLGLIGAVSFWILLFSFLSMIYCFFADGRK